MAPLSLRVVAKEVVEVAKVIQKVVVESLEIGNVLNVGLVALLRSPSVSSVVLKSRKALAKAVEAKVVGMLT